jgi:hypothetical protein
MVDMPFTPIRTPEAPHEFLVRGRVRPVDEGTRATLAPGWSWQGEMHPPSNASSNLRVIATGAAAPGQTAAGAECHLAGAMESALTRGPAPW